MPEGEKREHVGRTIRQEISIDSTPDVVFAAWADPRKIARWFVDAASGECRSGSVMTWRFDSMGFDLPVLIVEAVPGAKLLIAGEVPGRPPVLQEVLLEKRAGGTHLCLLHSGFGEGAQADDEYEGVDSGWRMALATLKHVLEKHRRGARTHVLRMHPARFEYEDVVPLYFTEEGLASWLGDAVSLAGRRVRQGARISRELGSAGRLAGHVVAHSRREVLFSWPQRDALLTLKAFSLGPAGRALALDYNAWTDANPSRTEIESCLDSALERLSSRLP